MTSDRKLRLTFVSGTGVLFFLAILAFVNLLADRFFHRLDLTADRRYSLSEASRQLIRSLEDPVLARFYLTPSLPQPYESQGRYILDLLQEYRTASGGAFHIETIVPDNSDAMAYELHRLKLQTARFTQRASDQFQVREGYMGLVFYYQDKMEILPFVREVDNLEYEISSRLRVMSRGEKKTLFFISNHNEVSPNFIKEGPAGRLFDEFRVESTRVGKEDPGVKPDAIFFLGPKALVKPEELEALDAYISSGVPVVIALNRRVVFPQNFRSIAQATGLEEYLEHYGVSIDRDFVMDEQCQNMAMQSRETSFYVKYWPFPMATDLNRENPALRNLDVLGFPYAHGLSPSFEEPSALRYTWLARSSKRSWVWPGLYNVDPPSLFNQAKTEPPSQWGPFTLAALVEGSTETWSVPRRPVANLKLVVAGTSLFADPQVPNPDGNALFILAMAQWLTQEKNYLAMPPKSSPYRPLKPVPGWLRVFLKSLGYFLVPGLIVLAGLWRWKRRQEERDAVKIAFAPKREVSPHA